MKIFAYIFARGGSKGIPGKNIKTIGGKPLLEYSINSAMENNLIDRTFVSTDCKQITQVAEKSNITVIDRPKDLALDNSPEWLAWQHQPLRRRSKTSARSWHGSSGKGL